MTIVFLTFVLKNSSIKKFSETVIQNKYPHKNNFKNVTVLKNKFVTLTLYIAALFHFTRRNWPIFEK